MAEKSYLWTTGGSGDGTSTYTQVDTSDFMRVVAACYGFEGVAPTYLNNMSGSVTGANTVAINTGGAMVDGKPYYNSTSVNVNIPSTVSTLRIDRIILQATWSAFTVRITRVAGVESASPSAPVVPNTSGVSYGIKLYQAQVNSSGTVTLTDERTWAAGAIASYAPLTAASLLLGNASGVATATAMSGDITISSSGVTAIGASKVLTTMLGNNIAQLPNRQGGSATDWNSAGSTNQTVASKLQVEIGAISVSSFLTLTFPTAFSAKPVVFCQTNGTADNVANVGVTVESITTTTCVIAVAVNTGAASLPQTVMWMAIGPA